MKRPSFQTIASNDTHKMSDLLSLRSGSTREASSNESGTKIMSGIDFETDDGELLVVYDYHCPECRAKLASWGTT